MNPPTNNLEGLVKNTPVGGSNGTDFEFQRPNPVRTIELWWGVGTDIEDAIVLRGLRVSWVNETESASVGSHDSGLSHTIINFSDGERVTQMTIRAGWRADKISFHTNKNFDYEAGGEGGEPYEQEVGNGTLLGFWGASGKDIDRLGAIFQDK
ncbi:Jacalin-like lectin domain-containing protein [Aspergillus bertholletiae]|uniref:Jacalin-like lectin domain-containing protein n=1 Tax=Aspergillus bertholletiae TaxID=1226010 RepID=A0A5N7BGR1_9EURO|nr:Jacalin-like lectin domain-containing protein [Aspergillus bertholletiae]